VICKSRALSLLALAALWLQACGSLDRGLEPLPRATVPAGAVKPPRRIDDIPDAVPRKEPRSRYGNPETYEVFGRTYRVKRNASDHIERGTASWYGPGFHAERTSSGEPYDMYAMTAAHKTLPIPVYVRVTNLENGRAVVVRVNDRGPFVGDRIIDLSYTAAHKLDMVRKGTASVELRVIEAGDEPPPTPVLITAAAVAPAAASSSLAVDIGVSSRYLQTGSFAARDNAEAMVNVLARSGIRNASVREARLGERAVFRVRVGPLDNAVEAADMIERLRVAGVPDARPAHE